MTLDILLKFSTYEIFYLKKIKIKINAYVCLQKSMIIIILFEYSEFSSNLLKVLQFCLYFYLE